MNNQSTVFTPSSLIAGRVPVTGAIDPYTTAFHAAAAALDDERIQLIAIQKDDSVYYLAAPAVDFASALAPATTPLAQALPGWSGHQGPGHYWATLRNGQVAVVRVSEDGSISVFTGLRDDAERFAGKGPHFWPEGLADWRSVVREAQRDIRMLSKAIASVSFAIGTAMLVGSIVTMGVTFKKNALHDSAKALYRASAEQVARTLSNTSDHNRVWRGFVTFAHAVVDRQGRAMKYADDGNGRIEYEVMLPVWTKDFTPFDGATKKDEGGMYLTLSKGGLK